MNPRSRSRLKMLALAAWSAGPCALAGPNDWSLVMLPDTQYYSQNETGTTQFHRQTQWIVDNQAAMNTRFVAHVGDIVNNGWDDTQWSRAVGAMNTLKNSTIPF